jgi:hypothetical protein
MFCEEVIKIKLLNSKAKVLKVFPALNNTFVLLVSISAGHIEQILHIDQSGKELFK